MSSDTHKKATKLGSLLSVTGDLAGVLSVLVLILMIRAHKKILMICTHKKYMSLHPSQSYILGSPKNKH